jgi:predicted AAA+ superfamily ATPase
VVYINFESAAALREIFLSKFDVKRLITNFGLYPNRKIIPNETLIVLDEIQSAPYGITSLKYFYENAPEYQIVAVGSLSPTLLLMPLQDSLHLPCRKLRQFGYIGFF